MADSKVQITLAPPPIQQENKSSIFELAFHSANWWHKVDPRMLRAYEHMEVDAVEEDPETEVISGAAAPPPLDDSSDEEEG